MAAFINDDALDALLEVVDDATVLHICSALPTTYAQATSTYSLGSKASPSIGSPGDASPNGRKVTVSAITGGAVSADGTASHVALVDGTRLLAAQALDETQSVYDGNTFSLDSFDVRVPDAA